MRPPAAPPGYLAFYRARWAEGRFGLCDDPELKSRARRCGAPDGRWDVRGIAEASARRRGCAPGGATFGRLSRAFAFLELLCVNLRLCPWRREIRALKTFTGNFVYHVQSVLPDGVLESLLEEIGYVATTATEFSLVRKLNEAEVEQAAFDLFLARIQCEDIFEMAKGVQDSDLEDMLQKRAQKYEPPEDALVQEHQLSQREEYGVTRRNEMQGRCSPRQAPLAENKLAFDDAANGGLGLKFTADESQPPVLEFTSEPNTDQSHGSASENSCVKSTDSMDFLVKYSDIVIGQKPLHLSNLSPKEKKTQTTGLLSTMLGEPADRKRPLTVPSPDGSGPRALAILNDATLESGVHYGCRSQGSSQEAIELRIRDAMKCLNIHESDSTDEPKELKGNPVPDNKISSTYHLSREEETQDLPSTPAKLKTIEDGMEGLMYPIEETAQPELNRSRIGSQVFSHSRMKMTHPPGGSKGVDLYSSNQFYNITGCEYPSVRSDHDQLLVGIPGAHGTGEGFIDISRPSGSTLVNPPGVQCGPLTENQRRGDPEGCPFTDEDASFDTRVVKMNDADTEGYVVISRDR